MAILDTELATYNKHRAELLAEHEGEVVLIHGDKILGFFASDKEALTAGCQQVGTDKPFLVKPIARVEPVATFTRDIRPAGRSR